MNFKALVEAISDDHDELVNAVDSAYAERNRLVAALVSLAMYLGWKVGRSLHDPTDKSWEDDWRNIIFIDLPTGQVSWHIHERQMFLFASLPWYQGGWDGHSTPEKYARVADLSEWVREHRPKAQLAENPDE